MKTADRINNMQAYTPIEPVEILAARLKLPREEIIKLDANENPYGASPLVGKALSELKFTNIYPDPESRELRTKLSEVYSVPTQNLLTGSGADELIDLLLRVMLNKDDTVLNCPPTFGMYDFDTILNQGKCINVPRSPDFSLDLDEIKKAVYEYNPNIIFICSPNNPDGGILSDLEYKFLISLPTLVILDEAYIEFSQKDRDLGESITRIREVQNHQNLVVLRTFSKWAGLAGLRIGFGAFPEWLCESLWKAKQPYNVNIAANAAAIASLKDCDYLANNISKIQAERYNLFEQLKKFSQLSPYPSNSNFILCKVKDKSAKEIRGELAANGIFIRHYNTPQLKDHIRITVGKPADTIALINKLEGIL